MSRYQPIYYWIDEYAIPSLPSIVIYDAHLDVDIDSDGDICFTQIAMRDDNDKVVRFIKGDWLFDILVKNIYADKNMMSYICKEASLDNDE